MQKTNVMRILDKVGIPYKQHDYTKSGTISGTDVAKALSQDPKQVFKTLVTISKSNTYYVFVIPVEKELDLKKAATIVNEKAIEMIKQKDLLKITGYIHGGCSPIGMKKEFITVIDKSIETLKTLIFSAGKIGYQVEISVYDLQRVMNYTVADICK